MTSLSKPAGTSPKSWPIPSIRARLVTKLLRLINRRRIYETPAALRRAAATTTPASESDPTIRKLVTIDGDMTRDFEIIRLTPSQPGDTKILYIHGGGWVFPARKEHWRFLAKLSQEAQMVIHTALYPLAPKYTYRDVMSFLLPVYQELVRGNTAPVIVMGDSAGANIALSLMAEAHIQHLSMPACLVLISPVVDLALDNPAIASLAPSDPMLAVAGARAAAQWYAGDLPVTDCRLSPLRGPLSHLPRTQLFIGTNDLLLPDCRLFCEKAQREGVDLEYHEGTGLMHVWPILPFLPEARNARRRIVDFIKSAT